MKLFLCNNYLILLLSVFSHMMLDIGGEVSPSFIFILATSPFWIKYLNWTSDKTFRIFTKLFVSIIIIQIIWALFNSETDSWTQLKGIMITVSGLLFFMYYYFVIRYNPKAINWYVLGTFIASFFFIDMVMLRDEELILEEGYLWKFQLFPRIVSAVVCVYLFFRKNYYINRFAPIAFVVVGVIGLATGARNFGLTPFIAGGIIFVLNWAKTINMPKLRRYTLIGVLLLYSGYAFFYVPAVLNEEITGGNTLQLKKAENPYNPFQLLVLGRGESIVPFQAFLDKPLEGWGYYSKDPDYKYHRLLWELHKESRQFSSSMVRNNFIPGHSVWGYYSCSYGILAFILWMVIIYKFSRIYIWSLTCKDDGILFRTYLFIAIWWDFLFSATGAFKLTMGVYMAFVIALSIQAMQNKGMRIRI